MTISWTTPSDWRNTVLAVLLATGILLLMAVQGLPRPETAGSGDGPTATGPAPAGEDGTSTESVAAQVRESDAVAEGPPTPAPAPIPATDEERIEGRQVAADFIAQYASVRYDESDEERVSRILPFASGELGATLSLEEGGPYNRFELAERRQTTMATVQRVHAQTVRDDWMDLVVIVRLEHTTVDGADSEWSSHLTRVVPTPSGWEVDAFQP